MGVSGCGKSSVGAALGQRLGLDYLDGDDLHPAANIDKMRRGVALDDADRWPWLQAVGQALAAGPRIVGCSALKRRYRDLIRSEVGAPVIFVHLAGSKALIAARMAARMAAQPGHFMPSSLLDSQFAALEPPGADEAAVQISIDQPLDRLVADIAAQLSGGWRGRSTPPAP
nr:gluconokinase [Rhodobacter sp. SW2]